MDHQMLIEAARKNDTTDLEAKLVKLSPDVLDQLILEARQHNSKNFAQQVIRFKENLASTENQNPYSDTDDESGLADGEDTDPRIEMAPINRADPNTRNGREFIVYRPPEVSHEHTVSDSAVHGNVDVTIIAVLVGFFGLMSGSTFAAIFALKAHRGGSEKLIKLVRIGDMFHFNKWPAQFYVIVFLTIGFTVSLVVAVVSISSVVKERPFCLRALVFVAVTAFFPGYGIALKDKVPKFSFGTQSFHIPSYWLVFFYGFALVFLAVAIFGIVLAEAGRILSSFRQAA